jgi:DNA polymerase III subunit epsilon
MDGIVLDTETTGLKHYDEICEIAIINLRGDILIDTLVRPRIPIPQRATDTHGITNAMVKNAPTFADISPEILKILNQPGDLYAYGARFDIRMLQQSAAIACGCNFDPNPPFMPNDIKELDTAYDSINRNIYCVMERFATIYGEWNDYWGSHTWQKLSTAAEYYGYPHNDISHRALADCRKVLYVLLKMKLPWTVHKEKQSKKKYDDLMRLDPYAVPF